MKVTARKLSRMYQALQQLAGYTLPSDEVDMKVATLQELYLEKAYLLIDKRMNAAFAEYPVPDDHEETEMPARLRELRAMARERILNLTITIPDIPEELMIAPGDLPKRSKGNPEARRAIAAIVAGLGEELFTGYKEPPEPLAEPTFEDEASA